MSMKRIYFLIIFSLFSLNLMTLGLSQAPFCCQTAPGSGQYRCYNSGICCNVGKSNEFWDPSSCHNFEMWVEPKSMMFTVATNSRVNLYIKNTGTYADKYYLDYKIENSENPSLIQVVISKFLDGDSKTKDSANSGQILTLYPEIAVLSTEARGDVFFNATSEGDPDIKRNVTFTILESDLPLSLSEFDFLGLIVMMILVGIIYFINRIH